MGGELIPAWLQLIMQHVPKHRHFLSPELLELDLTTYIFIGCAISECGFVSVSTCKVLKDFDIWQYSSHHLFIVVLVCIYVVLIIQRLIFLKYFSCPAVFLCKFNVQF